MELLVLLAAVVMRSVRAWGERDETSVFGYLLSFQIVAMLAVLAFVVLRATGS